MKAASVNHMHRKVIFVLVLIVLLGSPLCAQVQPTWHLGYDSTILSQGAMVKVSLGSFSASSSLQYSFNGVVTSALMGDEDVLKAVSRSFLITCGMSMAFPVGSSNALCIGPKVYALTMDLHRWLAGSLGLDISYEIGKPGGREALVIGAFIPLFLHFDGDIKWAWDEFGFAISPSVGYCWRL